MYLLTKDVIIFSFDLVPLADMPKQENLRAPEEICLINGARNFRRTIVSVRVNPSSPYRVDISDDGRILLELEGKEIAEVQFPPVPKFYEQTLSNGKPITDIAPTIEWGYLLYLTVFRICQYFGKEEECQFCDINENYRQQKRSGRPYTGVKTVEEIIEALEIVNDSQPPSWTELLCSDPLEARRNPQILIAETVSLLNIIIIFPSLDYNSKNTDDKCNNGNTF